jgi:glycosyltransferase involved in cell wall biosynthesis
MNQGNRRLRLLSISHSYCVALNRRLAHEMARLGQERWDVTAVAPVFFNGELRPISLELGQNEACRLEPVPAYLTRQIHLMFYGRRLKQILAEGWDLVHSWEEPYILASGQIASWTDPTTPLVFWTAQNLVKTYPPPFNWIEQFCLNRCDGWMACGQSIVDTQLSRGYGRKPYEIMPLGVDIEQFRPDRSAGAEVRRAVGWECDGPPVVGYLGRFVSEKGVGLMMKALDAMETPWRALFVGRGPLEPDLRRWAERHGSRVALVTDAKHNDVPAHINAMDVLCAPSQTRKRWREQFGRMLVEAFACGVPVICSDSGEIPYVVADAGVTVGESDVAGWTSAISELLENPARRADFAARGIERASAHFSWPVIAQHHLDFFARVLEAKANRSANSPG